MEGKSEYTLLPEFHDRTKTNYVVRMTILKCQKYNEHYYFLMFFFSDFYLKIHLWKVSLFA